MLYCYTANCQFCAESQNIYFNIVNISLNFHHLHKYIFSQWNNKNTIVWFQDMIIILSDLASSQLPLAIMMYMADCYTAQVCFSRNVLAHRGVVLRRGNYRYQRTRMNIPLWKYSILQYIIKV